MHWKTSELLKMEKARISKLELKGLIIFFDINSVIMTEWVPQKETVN